MAAGYLMQGIGGKCGGIGVAPVVEVADELVPPLFVSCNFVFVGARLEGNGDPRGVGVGMLPEDDEVEVATAALSTRSAPQSSDSDVGWFKS